MLVPGMRVSVLLAINTTGWVPPAGASTLVRRVNRLVHEVTVVDARLADEIHRVVTLEHDGSAIGHRRRAGEDIERGAGRLRNLEEGKLRDAPELAGAGDQASEGVGVDAGGPELFQCVARDGIKYLPYRRMVATGGHGVRPDVDARERRRLDEHGVAVVGLRHQGVTVEDLDDRARRSHVAREHPMHGFSQPLAAPAARTHHHHLLAFTEGWL